ncbi:hypothetical protein JCM3774_001989 [Rhodotorula dairenensis]
MASPFKRKPALVRTYGTASAASPASSLHSKPPAPKPTSALDRLLADSSDEEQQQPPSNPNPQPQPERASGRRRRAGAEVPSASTRRRSTTTTASDWAEPPGTDLLSRRRTSPRKRTAYATGQGDGEEEQEEERAHPPSPPRRRVKRSNSSNNLTADTTSTSSSTHHRLGTVDDEVPAPQAFVPLAQRLIQQQQQQHAAAPPAPTRSPSPKRPRPRKATTTAPSVSPARRWSPAVPSSSTVQTVAPTAKRPPSPVKDLTAVFSRFAAPAATTATRSAGGTTTLVDHGEQHEQKVQSARDTGVEGGGLHATGSPGHGERPTTGLKRGKSLVGGMAGPVSKRIPTADNDSDDRGDKASQPDGRLRLGRTYSQPDGIFHPDSSGATITTTITRPTTARTPPPPPASPTRPRLGSSLSVPVLPSPTKDRGGGNSPFPRPDSPGVVGTGAAGMTTLPTLFGAGSGGGGASTTRTYGQGSGGGGGGGRARTVRTAADDHLAGGAEVPSSSALGPAVPGHSGPSSLAAVAAAAPGSVPSLAAAQRPRETYASLRLLWGIDAEESLDADEDQDSQDRGAKVVGSGTLRRQGQGKRWMDELGWMCEGLRQGGGGGGRDRAAARSSAVELVGKALERDWSRRLKSSGQAETVYLALRTATTSTTTTGNSALASSSGAAEAARTTTMTHDRVLDVAIAVTLALFVRDQRLAEPLFRISPADVARTSSPLVQGSGDASAADGDDQDQDQVAADDGRSDLVEVLKALLEREWATDEIIGGAPPAVEMQGATTGGRKGKVPKSDARHLQALRAHIEQSRLFASSSEDASLPISIRSLVLLTLRSVACFAPRPIFQPQALLCRAGVLEYVARDFLNECTGLQARLTKYEEGLALLAPPPAQPQVSLSTLSLHLSIFEATSLAGPLAFDLISSPELLPALSLAFTHLTHASVLLALDQPAGSRPAPVRGLATGPDLMPPALRTVIAVLGILLALSSDERWSVALVEADLLPTLVRTAVLSRRAGAETTLQIGSAVTPQEEEEQAPLSSDALSASGSDAGGSGSRCGSTTSEAAPPAAATEQSDSSDQVKRSRLVWDVLSLSVGVLANILDAASERVGDSLVDLRVNPSCRNQRKCARACRCPRDEQETALAALCRLAIDPLDDAVDSVYRASVHGFVRLALGLSLLSSERAEVAVTEGLERNPDEFGHVLDALEGFANLYDERDQARMSMLGLPPPPPPSAPAPCRDEADDEDADVVEMEDTQVVDETQPELADDKKGEDLSATAEADLKERTVRMRGVVQRLRRRTETAR